MCFLQVNLYSQQDFCYDGDFISCGETITGSTFSSDNDFDADDYDDCRSVTGSYNGGDNVYYFNRSYFDEVNYITLDQSGNNGSGSKLDIFIFSDCTISPSNNPCIVTNYNNGTPPGYQTSNTSVIRLDEGDPGLYYIVVDGSSASTAATYSLTVSCEGFNCNDAIPIDCDETIRGAITDNDINNNTGYTPNCIRAGVGDRANGMFTSGEDYYRFTAPEDGDYTISLDIDGSSDLELFVINADFCCDVISDPGGVHVVADGLCDAPCELGSTGGTGADESVDIKNGRAGDEYIIIIDGFRLAKGGYELEIICGDDLDCDNLFNLICGIQFEDSNNPNSNLAGATVPTDLLDQHNICSGLSDGCKMQSQNGSSLFATPELVYFFDGAQASGDDVTFDLFPRFNGLDLDLFVYETCDDGTLEDCYGASTLGPNNNDAVVINNIRSNRDYYIVVDGQSNVSISNIGNFGFSVTCGLLQDHIPIAINCGDSVTGNTTNSMNRASYYCNCSNDSDTNSGGGNNGKEEVYSLTIDRSTDIDIVLDQFDGRDMELFLLDELDAFVCNLSSKNQPGEIESIKTTLEPGTYYIVVEGFDGDEGSYRLTVEGCEDEYCDLVTPYGLDESDESPFVEFVTDMLPGSVDSFTVNFPLDTIGLGGYEFSQTIVSDIGSPIEYVCPEPGCYFICFWYVDADGLLQSCCIKYCAEFPSFDCGFSPVITLTNELIGQPAEEVSFSCSPELGLNQLLDEDSTRVQILGVNIDTFISENESIILPYGEYDVCCWTYDPICNYWSICCRTFCIPYIPSNELCTENYFTNVGLGTFSSNDISTNFDSPPIVAPSDGVDVQLLSSTTSTFWVINFSSIGNYKVEIDIDGDGIYDCQQYICYDGTESEVCFDIDYKDENTIQLTCPDDNLNFWFWQFSFNDPLIDDPTGQLYGNGACLELEDEGNYLICKYYDGCCGQEERCCDTICYKPFEPQFIQGYANLFFQECGDININNFSVDVNGSASGLFSYSGSGLNEEGAQWRIYSDNVGTVMTPSHDLLATGAGGSSFNTSNTDSGFFDFVPGNLYYICYSYIGPDGCREYCCIKLEVPINCFGHDVAYTGQLGSLSFDYSIDDAAIDNELRQWFSSGGSINNPSDNTASITYNADGTYYVCCLLYNPTTRCYTLCCRTYCVENPFACGVDIEPQLNPDGSWNLDPLNIYGAEAVWMIDIPIEYSTIIPIGQQYTFRASDYSIPDNTEVTVSVSYIDNSGCRRICCKAFCPEFDGDCTPECYSDCCDGIDNSWLSQIVIDLCATQNGFIDGAVYQIQTSSGCNYYVFNAVSNMNNDSDIDIYECDGTFIQTISDNIIQGDLRLVWDCDNGFYQACEEACPNNQELFCENFAILPSGPISQVLPNWEQIGSEDLITANAFTVGLLQLVPDGHSRYTIPFDDIDVITTDITHNPDSNTGISKGVSFELRDDNNVVTIRFDGFVSIEGPQLRVDYNGQNFDNIPYTYTINDSDFISMYWKDSTLEVKYKNEILYTSNSMLREGSIVSIDIISNSITGDMNFDNLTGLCFGSCVECEETFVYEASSFESCDDIEISSIDLLQNGSAEVSVDYNGSESGLGFDIYQLDNTGTALLLAEETTGTWTCGTNTDYLFCYKFIDSAGCNQYCCIKIRIPSNCNDISVGYQGTDGSLDYNYTYQGNEEIIGWYGDNGEIGGDMTTDVVSYTSVGDFNICCLLYDSVSRCFTLCCRRLCVENPFECGTDIIVSQNPDNTFDLSIPGNNTILRWQIDIPLSLAGTVINPDNFDPTTFGIPAGTDITVSVTYIDPSGCLRVCCKTFCSSDPEDCEDCDADFEYDPVAFTSCEDMTIVTVSNISETLTGVTVSYIGSESGALDIYELSGNDQNLINSSIETTVTYDATNGNTYLFCFAYVDADSCNQYCCIKVAIPISCGTIVPTYVGPTGILSYTYSYDSNTTDEVVGWYSDDGSFSQGPVSEVITYDSPGAYNVCCLLWDNASQCYTLCCQEICAEDPLDCGDIIVEDYNISNGIYNLTLSQATTTVIQWQIDAPIEFAGIIDDPSNFNPTSLGIPDSTLITISVSYIDNSGCLKVCCKTICSSGPDNCTPCSPLEPDCDLFEVTAGEFNQDWIFDFDDSNMQVTATSTIITEPDGNVITQSGQSNTFTSSQGGNYTFCRNYEDDCLISYQCCIDLCVTTPLVCNDITVDITEDTIATFTHNIIGGQFYNWNFADGTTSMETSSVIEHMYPNLTEGYLATLTVFDYCGDSCLVSVAVDIVGDEVPLMANAVVVNPKCIGSTDGSISLNISGGILPYGIDWDGGPDGDIIWNDLEAGNYSVTITDSGGEAISLMVDVLEALNPISNIEISQPTCDLDNGQVEIVVSNNTLIDNYSLIQDGLVISTDINEALSNLSQGMYNVIIEYNETCVIDTVFNIEDSVVPEIFVDAMNAGCGLDNGTISFSTSDGTDIISIEDTAIGTLIMGSEISDLSSGDYIFNVTDINGCTQLVFESIETTSDFDFSLGEDVVLCGNENMELTTGLDTIDFIFEWYLNDTLITNTATDSYLPLVPGVYTARATDNMGCTSEDTIQVSYYPELIQITGDDGEFLIGEEILFNVTGAENISWFTNTLNLSCPDCDDQVIIAMNSGVLDVIAIDINGCTIEASFNILVDDQIVFPNYITPNSDGINDVLQISGSEQFSMSSLMVINKWGAVVFETDNYENDWGGVDNSGDRLPDGAYYYVIEYSLGNVNLSKTSDLTILKNDQ